MLVQHATLQRWVAPILTLLLCANASAAPLYHIVRLGLPSGGGPYFLTEGGQVFGNSALSSVGLSSGQLLWVYNGTSTIELGFTGPEYTRNDGYKYSVFGGTIQGEQILGASYRYVGQYNNGPGSSLWVYNGTTQIQLGFTGPEHTWSNGLQSSAASGLNAAGQVSGNSWRNGGVSAWLYDGATTIDIGLTGPEYTRNDGYKVSQSDELNDAGQVIGRSDRYNGSASLGSTAWLFDGAKTIDIGLTGPEHTRNDGLKASLAYDLNGAGQVIGTSTRFNGSASLGSTAWLYNGATTIDIGLTGAEHTRIDGFKFVSLFGPGLNEAGQVSGTSRRYNGGSADLGVSAWLHNGATTIDVGLTGPEQTRNDGYKRSFLTAQNAAGQVLGYSDRYNGGSTQLGQSVWLYNGATTIDIGLAGPEYTRDDGYKYSSNDNVFNALNAAGQALGYSYRYNGGSTNLGQSAWLYNGTTTIEIGLTGPGYTDSGGGKYSAASSWNKAGQVLGFSYNGGSAQLGGNSWLYDGATTIELGLTGPEYTRSDGYKLSSARTLNEAGQVIGSSPRYSGSTDLGQDAWFYDPTLHQTSPLRLSTRSDGYAYSEVYYLGKDGLVLGIYTLFDALDTNLGSRAFYFSVADGLHDLGALVDGGLAASGWDYLNGGGYHANGHGQIITWGRTSGGQIAYGLLTPISIPEPSSCLLAAAALGLCLTRRHRTRTRTLAKFVPTTTEMLALKTSMVLGDHS